MFNKKLLFKDVLPDWCLGCNMDLAQSLLRLSDIQKDDSIFSPFSFVATKKSHIQEMIDESDIENTTCSFLLSNILPHPQGTKTHTEGYLWQQGNLLFPEQLRQQEIYFILRNMKLIKWNFRVLCPTCRHFPCSWETIGL